MINKKANPMFVLEETELPSLMLEEPMDDGEALSELSEMGSEHLGAPGDTEEGDDLIDTTVLGLSDGGDVEHKVNMSLDEDDIMSLLPDAQMAILGLDLEDVEEDQPLPAASNSEDDSERETDWVHDGDHTKFISYITMKLNDIPLHSGQTTVGCEKALAHLKRLDRELSKAIQSDEENIIPETDAEKLRDIIYDWTDKLEAARDRLIDKKYKKNKKNAFRVGKEVVARINDGEDIQYFISVGSDEEETLLKVSIVEPTTEQVTSFVKSQSLTKEAGGAGIVTVEDPFLHSITRMLIQAHITHGKDIEEVYANLKDKYSFTPREELCVQELLYQKGFPIIKDLGRIGDEIKQSDGKGVEYSTTYQA